MPDDPAISLTDNPHHEGTYLMFLEGHDQEPIAIPFGKVPYAQYHGFKFQDRDERSRWSNDYSHAVNQLPLFSQRRWDAHHVTFPDDFPTDVAFNRLTGGIMYPLVHPKLTLQGAKQFYDSVNAGLRVANSMGTDKKAIEEASKNDAMLSRLKEARDDYHYGGLKYAGAKAVGDLGAGAVTSEVGGGMGRAVMPRFAGTMARLGEILPEHAFDVINTTVGANEDALGATNPARGYFHEPEPMNISANRKSIRQKTNAKLANIDDTIQSVLDDASARGMRFPESQVRNRMRTMVDHTINEAKRTHSPGQITSATNYWESFEPYFEQAEANGGFTPSDLWSMKKDIADRLTNPAAESGAVKPLLDAHQSELVHILNGSSPEFERLTNLRNDLGALKSSIDGTLASGKGTLGLKPGDVVNAGGRVAAKLFTDASSGTLRPSNYISAIAPEIIGLVPDVLRDTAYATGVNALGRGFASWAPRVASPGFATAVGRAGGAGSILAGQTGRKTPFSLPSSVAEDSLPAGGQARWMANGRAKLKQHLAMYPAGLSDADIDQMSSTPEGQRILINAGDLIPGSRAMESLITRIGSKPRR